MTKPDAPQDQPVEDPTADDSTATATPDVREPDLNEHAEPADDAPQQDVTEGAGAAPAYSSEAAPATDSDVAGDEDQSSPVYDQTADVAEPQDKKPVRFAFVGLAVGLLVGFCFNYAVTGVQEMVKTANATVITAAVTDCKVEDREGITVTDNGKKLTIDTKGAKEESGAAAQNAVCLIQSLNVPTEVIQKLDATKTGAGRQSTEWEQRALSWEFSADNGIMMEYSIKG